MNKTIFADTPPKSLREAMARSKLTINQIAIKLDCSTKSVYNWRNGKRPSDHQIGALSELLGINLWPFYAGQDSTPSITPPIPIQTASQPTIPIIHLDQLAIPERSSLLIPHLDEATQVFISNQLTQLWNNFHLTQESVSIITLRMALTNHAQLIESLAQQTLPDNDRLWILRMLSDAAILAGRIARDQLNYEQAINQHKEAHRLAIASRSSDQIIAATMRLAETLKDAGLLYEAVAYCKAGLDQAVRTNPRIHGELLGLSAEIYSAIGLIRESERLADEAANLAIGAAKLPTAGGINFSETAAAEYQMHAALKRGDTSAALAHIERGRRLLRTEFPESNNIRWEAHLWISQARAHTEAHDIEAACNDLRQALRLSQIITSQIAIKKIQDATLEISSRYREPISELQRLQEELILLPRAAR
jgi:tetratricopeptide (TPR) repeat protein